MSDNQRPTLDYGDLAYYLKCTSSLTYMLHLALDGRRLVSKDAAEAVYGINLLIEHIEIESKRAEDAEIKKRHRDPTLPGNDR